MIAARLPPTDLSRGGTARWTLFLVLLSVVGSAGGDVGPSPAGKPRHWDVEAVARLRSPPLGLPPVTVPEESPPTAQKVALGRKLFFDRRLSVNNTMSCAMCHVPEQGFTNNELATPIGVEGRSLRRNAPTILNIAYARHLFHDGREVSLETQVVAPLIARDEMANPSIGWLVARVARLADYRGPFERAFGGGPSMERIGQAIAAWERTLLSGDSRFDRWRYGGRSDSLSAREQRGFALFAGKAGCDRCHTVGDRFALFTDDAFHDTGIGYLRDTFEPEDDSPVRVEIAPDVLVPVDRQVIRQVGEPRPADGGRMEVTRDPRDRWRFKTPTLRNVALTAPYMHDGSLRSLEDVVRFYDRGGAPHAGLDPLILPLGLTDEEIESLVAFLGSLTGCNVDELIADARSLPVGN